MRLAWKFSLYFIINGDILVMLGVVTIPVVSLRAHFLRRLVSGTLDRIICSFSTLILVVRFSIYMVASI